MTNFQFSEEEMDLILRLAISDDEIFDASGMKTKDWKEAVACNDYMLVANTSPCREYGHTLRTTSGHCAVCNPKNMGFKKRYYDPGEIYIAYSEGERLVKIGASADSENRVNALNSQNYSNVNDWQLLFSKYVIGAYVVESRIHKKLSEHQVNINFSRSYGSVETSREVFKCDPNFAIELVENVIADFMKRHLGK